MIDTAAASHAFRQLASPTRLRLLDAVAGPGRSGPELADRLGVGRGVAYRELALLGYGGLVGSRGRGTARLYSLTDRGRRLVELARAAFPEKAGVEAPEAPDTEVRCDILRP